MKYFKIVLSIAIVVLLVTACGDDPKPTQQEVATSEISGTWIIESIAIDGLDASANYPAFKIDFQENGLYSSVNGGQLFRPTGTWSWADATTVTQLQLDVFTDVTITSFDNAPNADIRMTWSFTYNLGGVRAGTNGNYVVTFLKL
mgnify:CR=1 FL=1